MHGLLFAGLAYALCFRLPIKARVARLAGLAMLILLVMPAAVRWLDDGMETGIAVTFVSLLAWLIHAEAVRAEAGDEKFLRGRYAGVAVLAFLAVMLRTELILLCGMSYLILAFGRRGGNDEVPLWRRLMRPTHLLVGGAVALGVIVATMHVLLPDTAIAKSHGLSHWFNPIHDTGVTLGGAFSFGVGMLGFWLLTLILALPKSGYGKVSMLLANAFFPVVLLLACLRGQEIQGVRYFAWTLFFPIVWNILERAHMPSAGVPSRVKGRISVVLLSVFLALLAVETPFEIRAMFHVLTRRSEAMRSFESEHLEVLKDKRGVASDIGYIGYFTGAKICDLAGLVNGRDAALMSSVQRNQACMQTNPNFVFGNVSQLGSLTGLGDFSGWMVCGRYDFTNVRTLDSHYLVVGPALADEVCRATGAKPEPMSELFVAKSQ